MISTGFYGRPSAPDQSAKVTSVHLVRSGKGLCGYKPHHTMQFQWCSNNPEWQYIECPRCKIKYLEELSKTLILLKK